MITASTALTVFIMNIHFCCADAKPVPHRAKVLIINYIPKIILVFEVRENCVPATSSPSSSSSHYGQDDFHHPIFSPTTRPMGNCEATAGERTSTATNTPDLKHLDLNVTPSLDPQHHITRD
jgi:hypothetical protein